MSSSALHIPSGEVWYANELPKRRGTVERNRFCCTGCSVPLFPASYHESSKYASYFRVGKNSEHKQGCGVPEYDRFAQLGSKQSVKTKMGFPFPFPTELKLGGERPSSPSWSGKTRAESGSSKGKYSGEATPGPRFHNCTTRNIRNVVEQFLKFPHDRDLPLKIEGVQTKTYSGAFRYLGASDPPKVFGGKYIFTGSMNGNEKIDDDSIEIYLYRGKEVERGNGRPPYRVHVKTTGWPRPEYTRLLEEMKAGREESRRTIGEDWEKRLWPWLFFLGEQDARDPLDFSVADYRLICCWPFGKLFPKRP